VTSEPWSVEFERRADRDLQRLDRHVKQRVLTAIDRLSGDPRSAALRKLTGRSESRLRVGDWRVIVELEIPTRTIVILRVLPAVVPTTGAERR
jgi:mRNA-degrading endonuclease RelE of RelBE toxin-antitoxin system